MKGRETAEKGNIEIITGYSVLPQKHAKNPMLNLYIREGLEPPRTTEQALFTSSVFDATAPNPHSHATQYAPSSQTHPY
jgi:hypothetical protein